jgi:polyhydroxybutyrate depolymerase
MYQGDSLKKWLIFLGVLLALLILAFGAYRLINPLNGKLVSAGETRRYLLYVPKSYDPSVPTPLVVTLHGFMQWPANQAGISRWNKLADQFGFIVVYPSGTGFPKRWLSWNATGYKPDLTFISDLIDKLSAEYNIDPARIYANGLSNGGGMSFLLSCKLSERIAAIGLVSGAYGFPWEACDPSRPVPAIIFHGTADPIVPYLGSPPRASGFVFPSIPDWVATYAERNGCDPAPQSLPANGDVSGIRYTNCAGDVVFYTIDGGGHSWPGGGYLPKFIVGKTSHDIDATRTMWDFFQQHPLDAGGVNLLPGRQQPRQALRLPLVSRP